jgi:alpha-galactosidase
MKIVVIGAGSQSFGARQIADIMLASELRGRSVTLSLVDTDGRALNVMLQLAQRIKAHTRSNVSIEAVTDRREGLGGADYVITSVARKRYQLWEQDFRVPLAYGFRHCEGENGGPGAVFHALRSFELIMPICRDIEELCPDALVLNFTNPEARVLHAICHLTRVKAIGLCHGVFGAFGAVSRYLGRPAEHFEIISAGMNHFYCVLKVRDRVTGKDYLPELLQKVAADDSPETPPLFKKIAEVFGIFTFPSDGHIGEYLSYGTEFWGIKWIHGQEMRRVPLQEEPQPSPIEEYATGKQPLDNQILGSSGELAVPIICDIELDRGAFRPAVNVLNSEGYIENLPRDGVIEVPARADAKGVHPLHVGPLPEPWAAYIRTQFSIISLVTEAYRTRSKKLLLQALLLDPNVNSITAASKMLDEMLDLQRDYLPAFS